MGWTSFPAEGGKVRKNITNAAYGALDYASYPVGMLLVAPIILHRLGAAEYGLWMVATSIVSAGGIIASGFADAGIQQIAKLRGQGDTTSIEATIGALSVVHLALGCALALLTWWIVPYAAHRLTIHHGVSFSECITCLRVASISILVRAIETVPVCIQRAFEEYRGTVSVSVAVRLLTLSVAAIFAAQGGRAVGIMAITLFFLIVGTIFQFVYLRRWLEPRAVLSGATSHGVRALLSSGFFVWIQAVSSVLFRQFDRILLGLSLGAAVVAPYSLSIQISEPLFGLTASSLSFFFPYLAGRAVRLSPESVRSTVRKAFVANLLLICVGAALLLGFGETIMRAWTGAAIAHSSKGILPLIVLGSALSGLSVVGTYGAQALGMFRIVAIISVLSRCALLALMLFLLHHRGLFGLAVARLCYGAASLSVYVPFARRLSVLSAPAISVAPINHTARLQQEGQL
jgi:O-antigen/teichoic acid export membrane protein